MRVLVVEDSVTVRQHLVAALRTAGDIAVVGEAADAAEAHRLCHELRPDVITMDVVLPGESGIEATRRIMATRPTPVVVVSGAQARGDLFRAYDALAAGALEVLEKPGPTTDEAAWRAELLRVVRRAARIKVIRHLAGVTRTRPSEGELPVSTSGAARAAGAPAGREAAAWSRARPPRLIVVGASSGGPGALLAVLRALPPRFPVPLLVVLHMAPQFGGAFVDWLAPQVLVPVTFARDGEGLPGPGRARCVLAPPGRHLEVARGVLRLTDGAERFCCRPSVDVLFESVAREVGPAAVGCLLTGMGKDGASGLLALRRAGAATLVQDEGTSAVFGMPGEAIRLGAAERVLPLPAIGPALASLAGGTGGREAT